MKLSQLISAWESLRTKHDVGVVGFCDLAPELTNAGVDSTDDVVPYSGDVDEAEECTLPKALKKKKRA